MPPPMETYYQRTQRKVDERKRKEQKTAHPTPSRDMTNVIDHGMGRALCSDVQGVVAGPVL